MAQFCVYKICVRVVLACLHRAINQPLNPLATFVESYVLAYNLTHISTTRCCCTKTACSLEKLHNLSIQMTLALAFGVSFGSICFAYFRTQHRHMFFPIPRIRPTTRPLFSSKYNFIACFLISLLYPLFFPSGT